MAARRIAAVPVLAVAMAALLLSGCAKKHLYPGDRRPDDQVAYIEAERFLLAGIEFGIDGTPVGSLAQYYLPQGLPDEWLPGGPTIGASVLPGDHRLAAHVARYGWVTTATTACAAMTFRAEAGQRYRLTIDNGNLVMRNTRTGTEIARTSFAACAPAQDAARSPARPA
ncbi:MAG: hypothetical protein PVG24_10600 [Gammaproteobacteria bacterium]|jgi:hypothetical protein